MCQSLDRKILYCKFIYSFLAFSLAHLILDDYVGSCREYISVNGHVMQSAKIEVLSAEDDRGDRHGCAIILKE